MSLFDPILNRLGLNLHAPPYTSLKSNRKNTRKSANRRGDDGFLPHRLVGRQPAWITADDPVARGFRNNAIVYRCVRMIGEACASVPLELRSGDKTLTNHRLEELLHHPNGEQSGREFREILVLHLLLHGNAYVEARRDPQIIALYLLRPDRVQILPDRNGWPAAIDYTVANRRVRYDQTALPPPIYHMRLYHPQDDHYGLSPLEAANLAIDIHDTANRWNKSLFDNAARPSGALVYRGQDGAGHLTDEQFNRLKEELESNFQGARNAGRPLLLEGGLDWSSISLSPQDMDFIAAKHSAARDIALAFGVPPMLLGIPGDNTYANYAEANRAFWRQTVLPLTARLVETLERVTLAGSPKNQNY